MPAPIPVTSSPANRLSWRPDISDSATAAARMRRTNITSSNPRTRKSKTSTARRCRLWNICTSWQSKGLGSARVSRAGERVLAIADFSLNPPLPHLSRDRGKDCFGATPKPTRETRALPEHRGYTNFASRLICVPAKATETGQVFFVSSACSRNFASSIPGTSASVLRSIVVIFGPPPTISSFTVAVVLIRFAG